jgi:hypothetical protein
MLRRNKYLRRYPKFLWLAYKFAIGYLQLTRLSSVLCKAAFTAQSSNSGPERQAEMDIRQTEMKFTDQIERDLVQRFTAAVPAGGLNNAASALTYNGAWLTAVVLAAVALIWMLSGQ